MKVSVVIPTYNRAYIIQKAVNSVLNQTYPIYELIIVDDGSTDDTVELLTEMNNEKIKIINNKYSKGANGARNTGIDFASGNYIAFQDSDDIWQKDKLQEQMNIFIKNPEVDFCFTSFESSSKKGVIPKSKVNMQEISESLYSGNFIGTPTMMMKAKVAKELHFSEDLRRFQDWEFVLRISKKYTMYHLDKVLVIASQQEDSISKSNNEITLVALNELMDTYEAFKTTSIMSKLVYNSVKTKIAIRDKNYLALTMHGVKYLWFKTLSIVLKKESK